ncbi:MAG: helix-hairpin-helix domain-containing protein [archaeon]
MNYLILFLLILNFISIVGADCSGNQIDINSASEEELDEIIWVGSATAQKIIDGRPYETLNDIKKVYGIGDSKLEDIKGQGLACVEGEYVDEELEELEKTVEKEVEVIVLAPKEEEIVLNNAVENTKEEVYESKNFKILKYTPYAFSVFLIFVIAVLIFDK